jgi:hypothetical protein
MRPVRCVSPAPAGEVQRLEARAGGPRAGPGRRKGVTQGYVAAAEKNSAPTGKSYESYLTRALSRLSGTLLFRTKQGRPSAQVIRIVHDSCALRPPRSTAIPDETRASERTSHVRSVLNTIRISRCYRRERVHAPPAVRRTWAPVDQTHFALVGPARPVERPVCPHRVARPTSGRETPTSPRCWRCSATYRSDARVLPAGARPDFHTRSGRSVVPCPGGTGGWRTSGCRRTPRSRTRSSTCGDRRVTRTWRTLCRTVPSTCDGRGRRRWCGLGGSRRPSSGSSLTPNPNCGSLS